MENKLSEFYIQGVTLILSLIHMIREDFLMECFMEIKRDKDSGVDGVSAKDISFDIYPILRLRMYCRRAV